MVIMILTLRLHFITINHFTRVYEGTEWMARSYEHGLESVIVVHGALLFSKARVHSFWPVGTNSDFVPVGKTSQT